MTSSNLFACTTGRSAAFALLMTWACVDAELTPCIGEVGPVAHEAADFDKLPSHICRRDRVARAQLYQLNTPARVKRSAADEESVRPLAYETNARGSSSG